MDQIKIRSWQDILKYKPWVKHVHLNKKSNNKLTSMREIGAKTAAHIEL